MTWICKECQSQNDDSLLRCTCGYEEGLPTERVDAIAVEKQAAVTIGQKAQAAPAVPSKEIKDLYFCKKCGHYELTDKKLDRCPKCNESMAKGIVRPNFERFLFLVICVIIGLVLPKRQDDADKLPLLIPVFYFLGAYFAGFPKFNLLLPAEESLFSFKRFLKEFLIFPAIAALIFLGLAIGKLLPEYLKGLQH